MHLEGETALFNNLDTTMRQIVARDAKRGLKKAGRDIIQDAQLNLRRNGSNTTGLLSNTGKVQDVAGMVDTIDVGFMSGQDNYAGAVEYGRRAGKMPPVEFIYAWLKKKHSRRNDALTAAAAFSGRDRESLLRSTAWAIARDIGKHGTKPHPFFAPAVKANEHKILRTLEDAIKGAINRTR